MALTELLGRMASKVKDKIGLGDKDKPEGPQDGNVPIEGQALSEAQEKYGPNYEKLKELNPRIAAALEKLIMEYRLEALYAQRARIRRIRYARLFWQEIQYAYWNEGRGDFDYTGQGGALSSYGVGDSSPQGERYEFVTNFYQAYGLSFCALLSQDVPSLSIIPKSREVQEDITAARIAYDVAEIIEANNNPHEALETIARYLWTDGVVFEYWRYAVDGERFGYKTLPKTGLRSTDGMVVPEDQGQEKIPLGQEIVDYLGGLEVAVPLFADKFHDYGWLQWSTEPDIAQLKEAYPHAADGIQADQGLSAEQVFERISRLGIKQNIPFGVPSDSLQNLPTFQRTWLRRWAFNRLEDKTVVAELKTLFPDGCYCAFAGFEYCEARNETMDDHWRVRHALPGDGQSRPAVGQSLISPQERYNTLSNLYQETVEYGIPPIYADPQVIDFDALANQTAEPASMYPARSRPGMAVQDGFFQPAPAAFDASIVPVMQALMGETAQFLSGMFPAIFGGEMNDVQTASGYAMARDQAMGRIGLVWRGVKQFYAEGIGLGIQLFQKNRPEDIEVPFEGENDEEKAKWIRVADLKGNVMVRSEPDEGLPIQNSQQRAVLQQLISMGAAMPPAFAKALEDPNNLGWLKSVFGLADMTIPGEDSATKQMREIQILLNSGPMQFPPQPTPQTNPQTGQTVLVMIPAPPQPTVGTNDLFDDHQLELEKCIDWANSDMGQQAAKENPQGFMNVYLHAKMHADALAKKAQAATQQEMLLKHGPPEAPPPPKGPSLSMKVEDMPPDAAVQALAQDNIQVTPEDFQAKQDEARQDKADELQAKLAAKPAGESDMGFPK